MRHIFLGWLILYVLSCEGAVVKGRITDENGNGLAYTNIYISGTTNGTSANVEGFYNLYIDKGSYELIFHHLGYKQKIEKVTIGEDETIELNVSLPQTEYEIKDVLINGSEDPAIAVIRKAIEKRKYFLNAVESYSCDAYVKGVQRLTDAPFWAKARLKAAGITPGKDGIIYLSESQSKLYYKKPNKFREVVYSSKVSGKANGFTFNSAQNFYFNFYERNISIPFIGLRPFVSPLAENAFYYYNYKMIGAYREGDRLINKIQVTPKRKSDPCFSGILSIVEDNWNIFSLELFLVKDNGIQYLDTLKVTQYFVPVKNDLWLPVQQRYDATGGVLGIKGDGYYLGVFKNYIVNDIVSILGVSAKKDSTVPLPQKQEKKTERQIKKAEKKTFTAEVIKINPEANQREEIYWDSIRPVPLTELETRDYIVKDSIETIKSTKEYKDSTDNLLNKPSFFSILLGYTLRKQYQKVSIEFPGLLNLVNFNTVEGVNFQWRFGIRKTFNQQQRIFFEPFLRYGLSNQHFNAKANLIFQNSQIHNEVISISGGRYIHQFDENEPQPAFGNTWLTLIMGNNFMKLYEHYFAKVSYSRELYNGVDGKISVLYSNRTPLANTRVYTFFKNNYDNLTPNGVNLPGITYDHANINPHTDFRVDLQFNFKFGQQYVTRPDMKFRFSNDYPELILHYTRATAIKKFSDLDYDFLEIHLKGSIPLKLGGTSYYLFGGGAFVSSKNIDFADYKHFSGNFMTQGGTDFLGFFTLQYYRHSTNRYFAEAHIEHHFGGLLFHLIPGINKLKLDEVIGFHFLYTPTRHQYFQLDIGIANILKVLRVDFVTGFEENKTYHFGGRLGLNLTLFQ